MFRTSKPRGQGMLEFALILPALLMIVLSIIEGALLFQSYLAIQHAAREAARYAVTYQPPMTYSEAQGRILLQGGNPGKPAYSGETESEWLARRVALIKQRALDQAMGIRILHPTLDEASLIGLSEQPGFFGVRVWGFPSHDAVPQPDHPSLQGLPVRIQVYYRWEALDPLISAIAPKGVLLLGEAVMINEGIQVGLGVQAPPTFPPIPTLSGPTATPAGWTPPPPPATETPGPTSTPTTTPVPPTPTPSSPYLILAPEKPHWLEEGLPSGLVEVHNHPDGTYQVYWTDNCGQKTDLGVTVTTVGGSGSVNMPDPSAVGSGFGYLCPPVQENQMYTCKLSTSLASTDVPVYEPERRPDLVIEQVMVPPSIAPGEQVTVGVVIQNVGQGVVSGTFDVDIYVDPTHSPILKGQPGLGTAGGSAPKQWYANNMAPGDTVTLNYVIVMPSPGDFELWAQVDTSDYIDELDDENNISGPFDLTLLCSNACDDFDQGAVDGKWTFSPLGTRQGSESASVTPAGELRLEGTGYDIWVRTDGRSGLFNQGAYTGDFEMSVKMLDHPRGVDNAKAGLMVRESLATGERYVALVVTEYGGMPYLQVLVRSADDTDPQPACGDTPIPPHLFDGDDRNGEGLWLKIKREGQAFSMFTSMDGDSWSTQSCMQPMFSGFADPAVPGIWLAPYDPRTPRAAEFDEFRLCPLGASEQPPMRWKPPLLRECGNVLTNSDFEPFGVLDPWVTGAEAPAVVGDSGYSASRDGRDTHGFSMLLKCDKLNTWPYEAYHPWAYHPFLVPSFISSTQEVTVEMGVSMYYLVPEADPGRTMGRSQDQLTLVINDASGAALFSPLVVTHGAIAERDKFHPYTADLAAYFPAPVETFVGQNLSIRLEAPNPADQGDSLFYTDQIRLDVCTTVKPPEPAPGKVRQLSGHVQVILEGVPVEMEGIDVWAIQLPDGLTPPDQLDFQATYSIQDSTYSFFNLNPGTYRIYAEVWVSGNMYSAATTVSVGAGDSVTNVDLSLL